MIIPETKGCLIDFEMLKEHKIDDWTAGNLNIRGPVFIARDCGLLQ